MFSIVGVTCHAGLVAGEHDEEGERPVASARMTLDEKVSVANEMPSLRTPVRFSTSSTASAIRVGCSTR